MCIYFELTVAEGGELKCRFRLQSLDALFNAAAAPESLFEVKLDNFTYLEVILFHLFVGVEELGVW